MATPTGNPRGRPTLCTPELIDTLESEADQHWSINDACALLGINDTTWRVWRTRGNEDIAKGDDTDYARFARLAVRVGAPVRRRELSAYLRQVARGEDADAKTSDRVQAATTLMRLDNSQKVEHSGPEGSPIDLGLSELANNLKAMLGISPEDDGDES